jgi:CRP-like cAMP-binding protein
MNESIDKKVDEFFSKYRLYEFKKRQILINAHEPPLFIYKLESGSVIQYDISDQGNKIVVNNFKPPAYFPMSWAVNNTPNLYYYETTSETAARKAPPGDVVNFIKNNPSVMYELLSRVYLGREAIMRRMAHSMGGNAKSRILFELLLEGQRFGKKTGIKQEVIIDLKINDIAARTGLSRETASREISKMKPLGISSSKYGIVIGNLDSLNTELGDSL